MDSLDSILPAAIAFAAAVFGLLWTDRSKRRESERMHSHQANMFRRVLASDLSIASQTARANSHLIEVNKHLEVITIGTPKLFGYDVNKLGLLTVVEIGPVLDAMKSIAHTCEIVEFLASAKLGELYTLPLDKARALVESFDGLSKICDVAVTALKAETGP